MAEGVYLQLLCRTLKEIRCQTKWFYLNTTWVTVRSNVIYAQHNRNKNIHKQIDRTF